MSTEISTQGLLQVQELQQIVATAPEILSQNIESKTKAIAAGRSLIDIASQGMNDIYDQQLSTFIVKVKKTVDSMNERRKPFTQIVDSVKKQFTSLEGELKPILEEAQALRNSYATTKMEQKKKEEEAARKKLEHDKELIEIRKEIEINIQSFFSRCIDYTKKDIITYFNVLSLETIADADYVLSTTSTKFDSRYSVPTTINLDFKRVYSTEEEVNGIIGELLTADYSFKKKEYTFEIEGIIREYRDKLPSKKTELEAIAKAGDEEKQRLEKQAEERRLAEEKRLAEEANAREIKAQENASINASSQTAAAMVDATVITEAPNVKEAYSIQLASVTGYLLIFQFWFEKEGKSLPQEKAEKFTLDRMKRFCEAYALKNEEFIQSPLIKYEPIYKAK